jgi:sulfur relay (sulfurtransferase) complex TusBCD TusD component (DsrE family)
MENTTVPSQETAQITIQDLHAIKVCIEAAASRGAYRADEMKSVGTVYEKLSAFLQAAQAQASASTVNSAPPVDDPAAITPLDPATAQGE